MNLLSDMGYENIRGYLWYVFDNEFVEVNNHGKLLKLVATDLYNRTQGDLAHTAVVFLTNAPVCF